MGQLLDKKDTYLVLSKHSLVRKLTSVSKKTWTTHSSDTVLQFVPSFFETDVSTVLATFLCTHSFRSTNKYQMAKIC